MKNTARLLALVLIICHQTGAWIHNLKLQDDDRPRITMTRSFGFLTGGTVAVNVSVFSTNGTDYKTTSDTIFGFSLERSKSSGFGSYVDSISTCIFDGSRDESASVLFKFDLARNKVRVVLGSKDLQNLTVVSTRRSQYLYENKLAHGERPVVASQITSDKTKSPQSLGTETTTDTTTSAVDGTKKKVHIDFDTDRVAKKGAKSDDENSTQHRKKPVSDSERVGKSNRRSVREAGKADETKLSSEDDASQDSELAAKSSDDNKKADSNKQINSPKELDLDITSRKENSVEVFSIYFLVHIKTPQEEGLYNLFFHNCRSKKNHVNLVVQIIQDNNGNYLSADEMPIPVLYFLFSVVFFVLTVVWFWVLRRAKEGVYKIHYLMLVVVFFRSISDLFHGVNMHMIQLSGIHVDAWAILWYIVYLMRGAVMFVTVLLIGAGWAFIKHVFTDREKKLFLIVIPLQVLMNVAWVIMEESEEGYSSYNTWHTIFIGVDLLCCFAILFPVIWSIRHLQEASKTDGKAAINLNKLKLFRHFYIMVVAYIYFTRIIGYLLQITLPFRYGWMKDLFEEIFLLVFFTLTGYKFRPTSDNPYLQVPLDSDDEDIEMDEVVTKLGNMEALVRVNQGKGDKSSSAKQRESSHEYD